MLYEIVQGLLLVVGVVYLVFNRQLSNWVWKVQDTRGWGNLPRKAWRVIVIVAGIGLVISSGIFFIAR